MARRLKVFTWSDGFHAFTVAASSRPKALEAWGSKQDLFATGLASELSGGPDYEAALASPGDVMERGLAIDVGKIRKAAKPRASKGPTKAEKEMVATLEMKLEALDGDHAQAMTRLDEEAVALKDRRTQAEKDHERARRKIVADLKAARGKL